MQNTSILEMVGIEKSFPGVKALEDVRLTVKRGTVHALMGENGAGKSTLMKILVGMLSKDAGEIYFDGEKLESTNVRAILEKGISMIFQELNPIPYMTVAENIYIGREPKQGRSFLIDRKKMTSDAAELLRSLDLSDIDPEKKLISLSIAQMQMVEIAKAVSYGSKLIIMDEPTSSLTQAECDKLFKIIARLKAQGVSFIYISHKMDEIYRISDEITVMRDGQYICTKEVCDISSDELISSMVGRKISALYPKQDVEIGETALSVRNLTKNGKFYDVSFDVKKGEILGFSGLVGAGRSEVMEALFGYEPADSGEIYIGGVKRQISSPRDAIKYKLAFLTENRKETGIFQPLNIIDNIIMPSIGSYRRGVLLDKGKIEQVCTREIRRFRIKTPNLNFIINNLSGGNQQKVLLARWMATEPSVLILDEPTRGIDVGAKAEIYQYMSELAAQGKAIIMISSEMPEIIGMCDRVVVMHEGRISGVLNRGELRQESIMRCATGCPVGDETNLGGQ